MKSRDVEYKKLLKQAQKQPGVAEAIKAYGQYDLLLSGSKQYLDNQTATEYFTVSTSANK